MFFFSVCLLLSTDLEVYVLNTEADMQDLTFPHSYDSDSILQISALALQQYSSNGLVHTTKISKNICTILRVLLFLKCEENSTFFPCSAGQVKLVLTLYKNLGSFLTTQNSTLRLSLGLGQGSDARRRSLVVNSHVISASVHRGSSRVYLSEPVVFTLRHLQVQLWKLLQLCFNMFVGMDQIHNPAESCTSLLLQAANVCVFVYLYRWRTTLVQTALSGIRQVSLGMAGGPHRAAVCYTPTIHTRPVPATTSPAMLSS